MIAIYGLVDPRTDRIRYVGQALDPLRRYDTHMWEARLGKKSHKCDWIRSLLLRQLHPALVILNECTDVDDADRCEHEYLHSLFDLTNVLDSPGLFTSRTGAQAGRIGGTRGAATNRVSGFYQTDEWREACRRGVETLKAMGWYNGPGREIGRRGGIESVRRRRASGWYESDEHKEIRRRAGETMHRTWYEREYAEWEVSPPKCVVCGNVIPFEKRRVKTCSKTCSVRLAWQTRRRVDTGESTC